MSKEQETKEQSAVKINYKLVNKYKLLSGIARRAGLAAEELKRDLSGSLKDLVQKSTKADREREDFEDKIAIKQIDDENYQLTQEEKEEHKKVKRNEYDARTELNNKSREKDKEFTNSKEYKNQIQCEKELEEWLCKVSNHLGCSQDAIDWEKGTYTPEEDQDDIPEDLL